MLPVKLICVLLVVNYQKGLNLAQAGVSFKTAARPYHNRHYMFHCKTQSEQAMILKKDM